MAARTFLEVSWDQNDPGGDNDNASIEWTVGTSDYFVDPYFGGGLANAVSFRPFKL